MILQSSRHLLFVFKMAVLQLILLCSTALAQSFLPWEEGLSRPDDLQFEIYVFGPGPSIEEWWGHIGLRVQDTRRNAEAIYNWGMFAFDEKFLVNFATGRLRFWVESQPTRPSMSFYRRQGRHIEVLSLNLAPEQKNHLLQLIAENLRPENREYTYEYFRDNCSTRIRDLLDIVTGGAIGNAAKSEPGVATYRDHVSRVSYNNLGMNLLMSFLLGPTVDALPSRWTDMFLPNELIRYLAHSNINTGPNNSPLAPSLRVLEEGRIPENSHGIKYAPWDLILGFLVGIIALSLAMLSTRHPQTGRRILAFWSGFFALLIGIPGTVLFYFCTLTEHTYTYWNENILFANPLTLALVGISFWAFKRNPKAAHWAYRGHLILAACCLLALSLKLFPFSIQNNWVFLRFYVPAAVLSAIAWKRITVTAP